MLLIKHKYVFFLMLGASESPRIALFFYLPSFLHALSIDAMMSSGFVKGEFLPSVLLAPVTT